MASFITAGNATNGLQVSSDNTGILELRTGTGSGTTAVTFSTGQRATFPSTISVGNTTPATTGAGVTFPAAQSASSDANTLDDYEEGDWTPTIIGANTAGTTTYGATRVGRYTKVGRQVTCSFRVNYTAATGTGNLNVTGFPFTALEAIGPAMTDNLNWPNAGSATWYISGGTVAVLFISADDGAWQTVQLSNEAADIIGTITYFV